MADQTIQNIGQDGQDFTDIPATRGSFDPPVADAGTPGADGDKSCGTNAGQGHTGSTGLTGYTGGTGGNGVSSNDITLTITEMSGNYTLLTQGGNGGKGGKGGKGGPGQTGGPGGAASSQCGTGPQGQGGPGGVGGTGGKFGTGGDAGNIYVKYQSGDPTFNATVRAGRAGLPGTGGDGGDLGPGNPQGGPGDGGPTGPTPTAADNGKAGSVFINGVKKG